MYVIIFSDVLPPTVQPAGGSLMPRRRRSRYAFYRRLRLLRETQHRLTVRRSIFLALLVVFALPLMALPAIAAESVGDLPAVDGLSSSRSSSVPARRQPSNANGRKRRWLSS